MEQVKRYEKERAMLREELAQLKSCQISFLQASIRGTVAVLGLGSLAAKLAPGWFLAYDWGRIPWFVALFLFLFSACWNALAVWRLANGKYSYDSNEKTWDGVLKVGSRLL